MCIESPFRVNTEPRAQNFTQPPHALAGGAANARIGRAEVDLKTTFAETMDEVTCAANRTSLIATAG